MNAKRHQVTGDSLSLCDKIDATRRRVLFLGLATPVALHSTNLQGDRLSRSLHIVEPSSAGSAGDTSVGAVRAQIAELLARNDFKVADAATTAAQTASGGSAPIGFLQTGTGAVARTVQSKLRESVSVFDFMTAAEIADVQSGSLPTLDVSAAIQAALDRGGRVFFPVGLYGLARGVRVTRYGTEIVGESFTGTVILPLLNTLPGHNALLEVGTFPWNGGISNVYFHTPSSGPGARFTGWAIVGSAATTGYNTFSVRMDHVWCAFASTAAGFFKGGLYDSWVTNCQFENLKHRFLLEGTTSCGTYTFFTNINDINGRRPFIEAPVYCPGMVLNGITSRGNVGSGTPNSNYFILATDAENWKISNIDYAGSNATLDPVVQSYVGFAKLTSCTKMSFSNINIDKNVGKAWINGFHISGSGVNINNCSISNNVARDLLIPLTVTGSGNAININQMVVTGGCYDQILFAGTSTGSLKVNNSMFTKSKGRIIRDVGTSHTLDVSFKNCTLINPHWGYKGAAVQAIVFGTAGNTEFIGNTIGRDAEGVAGNASNPTAFFYLTGTGTGKFEGNNIIGFDPSVLYYSTVTQRLVSNFTSGNSALANAGTMNLPAKTAGVITVSANAEAGVFLFDTSGAVTKLSGTTNTAVTDAAGKLCVYPGGAGTYAIVKNNLRVAARVCVSYQYS